jgi:hypothetical protein
MTAITQVSTKLMILSILLAGLAGCAPANTPPPAGPPTPTVPPGWERHSASANQGQCSYAIDHPSNMDVTSQGMYNWLLSPSAQEPSGPVPNFVYISVIPDDFPQSGGGDEIIYNYDPVDTQTLLSLRVGESRSLRDDATLADWFTYTRLPDRTLSGQPAQTYDNTQPWEFPPGTKEIRYYLKANGCTYLVGGYVATVGSGQPGSIDEDLFDQIIATFHLAP